MSLLPFNKAPQAPFPLRSANVSFIMTQPSPLLAKRLTLAAEAPGQQLGGESSRAPPALRLLKTRPAPGSRTADEPAPAPLR